MINLLMGKINYFKSKCKILEDKDKILTHKGKKGILIINKTWFLKI